MRMSVGGNRSSWSWCTTITSLACVVRWHVVPLELTLKWANTMRHVDKADARGYCGTRERSIEMAEAAIDALAQAAKRAS